VETDKSQAALWAMMLGNIAIGLGAMAPAAMMNTLVRDFALPPQTIGHLISWAAIIMCIGAPGFAIFTNRWDRRKLLAGTMALYVVGHVASLFMTSFAGLMIVRLLMISSAAIFTPQAAAVVALISPPEKRAAATAHVFIGWSIATALGMPAMAAAADWVGWQPVMAMIALFSLIAGLGVWFTLKPGLRVAQLNLKDWLSLPRHPAIMALIAVTVLTSAGQFMLYPYLAAELKRITMAPETQIATLLAVFGISGLAGNRVSALWVGRLGPARINQVSIGMIMLALFLWAPLVTGQATAAICILLWGCGFASCNPMQQVRLGMAGPTLASASIALNTSGIYLGQWIGAAGGGALLAGKDYWAMSALGGTVVAAALGISWWAQSRLKV
jgi:MFS transporter, DHA1 family, inner membrane transport protein